MNRHIYRQFDNESTDSKGNNLEHVYANLLGAEITGGIDDHGVDLFIKNNEYNIRTVQVKSSKEKAINFLKESVRRKQFISVIVGDPGRYTKDEILKSLHDNGAWIGFDEDGRQEFLDSVRQVRELIMKNKGNQNL
jgi:hypothetical protein